jgi:uncharacterized membrane protein
MAEANANSRLEAFCDGVFAIALTLLVIDVKLPATEVIASNADFWRALQHLGPKVFAFLLSFVVILISWTNHHSFLKLVNKSSGSFIYANGILLLTVAFFPFPTSLLGEFLFSEHAAPAVVLYNAVAAAQAIGWVLMGRSALRNRLTRDEHATALMRINMKNGYYAVVLYSALSILAFWLPLAVAAVTTLSWIFWLVLGIRMKHE